MIYNDFEGIESPIRATENSKDSISPAQSEYINECVKSGNPLTLVDRIDELSSYQPPKGIDSNAEIAELVEPLKESIESKYLEAPSDLEQVNQIGDYLAGIDELKFENWKELSPTERHQALQDAEYRIAEIEHRDFCAVEIKDLPAGHYGYYSSIDKTITLNSRYVYDNDFEGYKETLDTLIHEGRHAYQDYNMIEREVHPRGGEVTNWKWNEYELGYRDAGLFGFEEYAMQPVETDARAFAEDVLNRYFDKTA